jgi:cystathionine beta-lyase/cystathionine gamma-synthase
MPASDPTSTPSTHPAALHRHDPLSLAGAELATRAVHGAAAIDPSTGAIVAPLIQSTTYIQPAIGQHRGYTYSRAANPTVAALERLLGALDDAPPAVAFGTGMAAISTLVFALCRAGDHVVCSEVIYGGTVRLLRNLLADLDIRTTFVDATDPLAIEQAIEQRTRLVLVETPANPTLVLTDIAACAAVCRKAGVTLAVDNTFLTAVQQRVFELGADVVIYSTTKYYDGHNATVGGAVLSRDERLLERLRFVRKTLGCSQKPFEAWLTLQGVKTLPLRLARQSATAFEVASYLERHERVTRVSYPGLQSFPQHALALRQQRGFGGLLSFSVQGGAAACPTLLSCLQLISLAENLGAAESLATHPVSMTHGDVPANDRERLGIDDGLIRLSIGLEDPAAIIADLEQALARSHETVAHHDSLCSAARG